MKRKWADLIVDPASDQLSMSRLCFGGIVAVLLGVSGVLVWQGKVSECTDLLKTALITTAGLYGANSVAGVISRRGETPGQTGIAVTPPPPGGMT